MKIVRALFLGSYRISHACLSLQFDRCLNGIDETYVFSPIDGELLDLILRNHNIDTSRFTYVADSVMDSRYPSMKNWWFDDDFRGSWLYQQALKMASLDYIDADVIMITDPDTFCIESYSPVKGDKPNYFILPNETHSYGYYAVLENTLGISRQTEHCFVSEFMPVFKEDWHSLKHTVEQRNKKDFFDAVIEGVPPEQYDNLRWFSEYEYLGNYVLTKRQVEFTVQKRFEYKTLAQLDSLTNEYNCVCDAIPKLNDSLVLDWDTKLVRDFDKVFEKVKRFL